MSAITTATSPDLASARDNRQIPVGCVPAHATRSPRVSKNFTRLRAQVVFAGRDGISLLLLPRNEKRKRIHRNDVLCCEIAIMPDGLLRAVHADPQHRALRARQVLEKYVAELYSALDPIVRESYKHPTSSMQYLFGTNFASRLGAGARGISTEKPAAM